MTMAMEGGLAGHDPPQQIQHCEQATAAQRQAFEEFVLWVNAEPELHGGFEVHRSYLVWHLPLVGGKRALAGADGSVRIWCVVCESAHALGRDEEKFGNFKRGHVLKPMHKARAQQRVGSALDVDALPEAAPAAEALPSVGVGFLRDEAAPAALPVGDGELGMVPQLATALLDLLAIGLEVKGGKVRCTLCSHELGSTTDGRVVSWARGHVASAAHLSKANGARGQQSIAQFGFRPVEQQQRQPCLGFHEAVVECGDNKYDVALIIARELTNEHFVTEKHTMWEYPRTRNGPPYLVRGCIRARGCTRIALDSRGSGPRILSCAHCIAIPDLNSFRMLARRDQYLVRAPDAPPIVPSSKVNFRSMPLAELVPIARKIAAQRREFAYQNMQLRRKLVALAARARTLAEKLGEMSARGETKQLIDYILRCERAGKFVERKAVFDFVFDMLRSLALTDSATGRRSNNMRWNESTLRVFASIKLLGGPKLNRMFAATLEAPNASTVSRTLAQTKLHLKLGPHADTFERVGKIYANLKILLNIMGQVPFELSEDETGVQVGVTLCLRSNAMLDFCGESGDAHRCAESCSVSVGDRYVAYAQIMQAFDTLKRASYVRMVVVNPLHAKLPKLVICVHGTCNGFDAPFIASSWRVLRELSAEHLSVLGPLIGHASDGDARRFHNQLTEMSAPPPAGSRVYALDAEGFTLHGTWDGLDARTIRLSHSQDPRHNLAKLYSHCAIPSRVLLYGTFVASHQLLVSVVHVARDRGEPVKGVNECDLARKDRQVRRPQQLPELNYCARARIRSAPSLASLPLPLPTPSPRVPPLSQNKEAPANCCSLGPRRELERCISGEVGGRPDDALTGTLAHLELISAYVVLFIGTKATLEERVTLAAFIVHLLRLARLHVVSTAGLTLAQNFFSRQTYQQVILSCHSAVLLVRAVRDINPQLLVCLATSGSDCCETLFSMMAGFGSLSANRRTCTVGQAVAALSDANTLQLYRADPTNPIKFGSRHHKADVDVRKHEDQAKPDADLADHKDDAAYGAAWIAGLVRAETAARKLGITVPVQRAAAWRSETADLASMRDASAEEAAEEAASAAGTAAAAERVAQPPLADGEDDDADYDDEAIPTAPDMSELARAPAAELDDDVEVPLVEMANLRGALEALASDFAAPAAAPAAAQAAAARTASDPMVRMPNGKLVWKATLIAQLQNDHDSGKKSMDRLVRVQQRQSELPPRSSAPAGDADDAPEQLDVRDNFAIAFHITDARGSRYEWWLGRVLALYRKSACKSFTQIKSVSLSGPLDDFMVVASWYKPTDATRAVYRHNGVNDTRKYQLGGSYLGCPRLDYDAEARVCTLVDAPRQIFALDASLAATKPLREGSERTVGEARALDARRREQQSAQWTAVGAAPAAPRDREASIAQRAVASAEQRRGGGRGGRRGGGRRGR